MTVRTTSPIVVGDDASTRSDDALELARALGEATGADVVPLRMEVQPAAGLDHAARRLGAGLIVVGSTHRGTRGRVFPGSTAERLMGRVRCLLAIAPSGYAERPRRPIRLIAVAYDATPAAYHAVDRAADLAVATGAMLRVIGVVGAGFDEEPIRSALAQRCRDLPAGLVYQKRLCHGYPADVLAEQSGDDVDLMFIGSRDESRLGKAMRDSVDLALARRATCPLVVVPTERGEP